MSLEPTFRNSLCQSFTTNVDKMSLHLDDPGTDGSNDSTVPHEAVTWSSPTDGVSTATVEYDDLTGDYTHIGLWDDTTFRQGIPCEIHYVTAADVTVTLTHEVDTTND